MDVLDVALLVEHELGAAVNEDALGRRCDAGDLLDLTTCCMPDGRLHKGGRAFLQHTLRDLVRAEGVEPVLQRLEHFLATLLNPSAKQVVL